MNARCCNSCPGRRRLGGLALWSRARTAVGTSWVLDARAVSFALVRYKVQGEGGAVHSLSSEEREAFAEHINNCLCEDEFLAK